MTIEEELKNLILTRYNSLREFTIDIDMAYSTMDSIIRRGIQNATLTNVFKICKALNISADALEQGKIVPIATKNTEPNMKKDNRSREITEIMNETKRQLLESNNLRLDGKPVESDSITSLIDAIDIGVEMIRRKNANK